MTVIDEDPIPYKNSAISDREKEPTYAAVQKNVRPESSKKNNINVITISFFVLSTECPTSNGINIEGSDEAARSMPKPAGEMTWSLIIYKPNIENELREKWLPKEILDNRTR